MEVDLRGYVNEYSLTNRLGRALWGCVYTCLFRPTPGPLFHTWRIWLLRLFGARIGQGCVIYPTCRIWAPWNMELGDYVCLAFDVDFYNQARITVGSHVTISQYSFLCSASHDVRDPYMRLTKAPITIGDGAWICAKAFVGPGITLGEGAVVGACAVATKNVEAWAIVVGNPARVVGKRELVGR